MVSLTRLTLRLITLTGCVLLSVGCSTTQPGEEAEPTRIPLPAVPAQPTYEVRRGEVIKELEFRGRIVPAVEEELFFRTSGYVGGVFVSRGDPAALCILLLPSPLCRAGGSASHRSIG